MLQDAPRSWQGVDISNEVPFNQILSKMQNIFPCHIYIIHPIPTVLYSGMGSSHQFERLVNNSRFVNMDEYRRSTKQKQRQTSVQFGLLLFKIVRGFVDFNDFLLPQKDHFWPQRSPSRH